MKLLILTTLDSFFLSHVLDRALYIKEQGWQVIVAAKQTDENKRRKIEEYGFKFYDTNIKRKSIGILAQVKDIVTLYRIYKNVSPDVCFHLGAKYIFWGTLVSRLLCPVPKVLNAPIGLGYIFISHSTKAKLLRPLVTLLYKILLNPRGSRVIVENNDDINFFIKINSLNKKCVSLIPGAGVDTNFFSPQEQKKEQCTVVMVSRLIREKGVYEFIEVAKRLHSDNINVNMELIGEPDFGSPSSITEKEYHDLKNSNYLKCYGYSENVAELLKRADIGCLPSYREGLPRALIEACSCGLAVVTTDAVGCREIVTNKNGILIPVKNVDALYDAIRYLVQHVDERKVMGKNSRILALTRFDNKIICKQTYGVLKDLLRDP